MVWLVDWVLFCVYCMQEFVSYYMVLFWYLTNEVIELIPNCYITHKFSETRA
jgi:hypothetical protein